MGSIIPYIQVITRVLVTAHLQNYQERLLEILQNWRLPSLKNGFSSTSFSLSFSVSLVSLPLQVGDVNGENAPTSSFGHHPFSPSESLVPAFDRCQTPRFFLAQLGIRGHLFYQPKQDTIHRKSLKSCQYDFASSLIPPKFGSHFTIPGKPYHQHSCEPMIEVPATYFLDPAHVPACRPQGCNPRPTGPDRPDLKGVGRVFFFGCRSIFGSSDNLKLLIISKLQFKEKQSCTKKMWGWLFDILPRPNPFQMLKS